jgi:hypothetical protein
VEVQFEPGDSIYPREALGEEKTSDLAGGLGAGGELARPAMESGADIGAS